MTYKLLSVNGMTIVSPCVSYKLIAALIKNGPADRHLLVGGDLLPLKDAVLSGGRAVAWTNHPPAASIPRRPGEPLSPVGRQKRCP